jgi:soluble lytic murein transglycosylase
MLNRSLPAAAVAMALICTHVVMGQETGRRDAATPRLTPTRHPVVPTELSQFWFVSPTPGLRMDADTRAITTRIARGIKLINAGDFTAGLALVNTSDVTRSPLAAYAHYYAGVALSNLSRAAEADKAYAAARERRSQGYLKEALDLRMAEAALVRGDAKRAVDLLDDLADDKVASPDTVLLMLGRAAEQAGDSDRALEAYRDVHYGLPLSAGAPDAQAALTRLQTSAKAPSDKLKRDRERAEVLFNARRWALARAAYEPLVKTLQGDEAKLAALRIAECDFYLDRFRAARDGVAPFLKDDKREAEARFFHLSAIRGLGDQATATRLTLELAEDHPTSSWSEEALNNLASSYIRTDDDDDADRILRAMLANAPRGRYAERAAWKIGWRAYRTGNMREAAETFERAAAAFPRGDNRPAWLYWSARARDLLNESALAVERYSIVIADYGNSYYGRLAMSALGGRRTMAATMLPIAVATGGVDVRPTPIPNESLIRDLVSQELYDDALREVQYAQRQWADSAQLQATTAYIRHNQGLSLRAEERFTAVRGAITTMRRAYPQFMTAGGDDLPPEVLRIIFPLDYWPLITKYSKLHDLDPFLVAALMAQESTFTAEIRSSANAHGLMQLIPSTGRTYAKKLGIRNFSTRMLDDPETNIRLGTEYFKDLMEEFGGAHYALAGYNAGGGRVRQWRQERPPLPADEFTDDIPFAETQTYVKRIIGTAEDYRRLYGSGVLDPNASLSAQAAQAVARSMTPASAVSKSASTAKAPATPARKPATTSSKPSDTRRR